MPSKTAMVLANQGDPIFGALGKLALRGAKAVIGGVKSLVTRSPRLVRSPQTGQLVAAPGAGLSKFAARIAKTKAARVVAEGTAFGGIAGVASTAVKRAISGPFNVEGEFEFNQAGCPTGKVVEVAAHTRIIPLDRFGRPRRRINVLNTKALSRATRRLGGFQKRARRVEKQLSRIAPRSRSRRRSKGVC